MTALTFDTLAYSKKLRAAGFTEQQAEVQTEAIAEIIEERLATKRDIIELKNELKRDILELNRDIEEMSYRLTIRMGFMIAASVTILGALIKF